MKFYQCTIPLVLLGTISVTAQDKSVHGENLGDRIQSDHYLCRTQSRRRLGFFKGIGNLLRVRTRSKKFAVQTWKLPQGESYFGNTKFDQQGDAIDKTLPPRWNYQFKMIRELGKGACGTVYEFEYTAKDGKTKRYAVKMVLKGKIEKDLYEAEVNATKYHEQFRNPYINQVVKVYNICKILGKFCIVLQLGDGKDLLEHMLDEDDHGVINEKLKCEENVKFYAACVVRAIETMHEKNVAHRDLKLANLIINPENGYLQVTDFGLCDEINGRTKQGLVGTPNYMSPEMIRSAWADGGQYGKEVDWWAFGNILYTLFTQQRLFDDNVKCRRNRFCIRNPGCQCAVFTLVCHGICCYRMRGRKYWNVSEEAKNLIELLLQRKINKRLTNSADNWKPDFGQLKKDYVYSRGWCKKKGTISKRSFVDILGTRKKRDGLWYKLKRGVDKSFYFPAKDFEVVTRSPRIRDHPWFEGFNWELLDSGKMKAPWVPKPNVFMGNEL